jgi:geranylgeranyl pyrophosphate synthase
MDDFERLSRYDRRATCSASVFVYSESADAELVDHGTVSQTPIVVPPFQSWRDLATARIEARIAAYVSQLPTDTLLRAPIAQALGGGKRFRGLLALACCEALGGDPARALDAALALEMVQAQSLILDDLPCMDDADTRRGQPTLHHLFGESLALLAAATLLSDAYAVLCAQADAATAQRVRILADACGSRGIAHGQAAELAAIKHAAVEDAVIEDVVAAKTSPLMVASARLGALCAPSSQPDQVESLAAFAGDVGLAYQLRDDALDGDSQLVDVLHTAQLALERALSHLECVNLDTPALRALARFAVLRSR